MHAYRALVRPRLVLNEYARRTSAGPVASSDYVSVIHAACPHVYAYAYDDGIGLAQCPAGVRYDVTFFCPE